jgi:hybrid cluster-associated redox disulfide protein
MVTWIAIVGMVLALVALAYAWKLQQELDSSTRRLDRYNRALFDANDELRRLREEMTTAVAELRVEIKRTTGVLRFEPQMTIREAQIIHPQTQQVLAGFHLGGCSSCAVDPGDTLVQACTEHGIDVNTVLHNLNLLLLDEEGGNRASARPVKLPNMELKF